MVLIEASRAVLVAKILLLRRHDPHMMALEVVEMARVDVASAVAVALNMVVLEEVAVVLAKAERAVVVKGATMALAKVVVLANKDAPG